MKLIDPEGTKFIYFAKTDFVEPIRLVGGLQVVAPPGGLGPFAAGASDVRVIAVPSILHKGRANEYCLFWRNPPDLDDLDRRVDIDEWSDLDFAGSVKTTYQMTLCDRCGRQWPTLVIPPGDPYPGAPGLLERKFAASKFLLCPACGAMLRQAVVKIA